MFNKYLLLKYMGNMITKAKTMFHKRDYSESIYHKILILNNLYYFF